MLNLRRHVLDKFYTDEAIADIPISIDVSWEKRYGFNSLLVVFLLTINSGCVTHYVVCVSHAKRRRIHHTHGKHRMQQLAASIFVGVQGKWIRMVVSKCFYAPLKSVNSDIPLVGGQLIWISFGWCKCSM